MATRFDTLRTFKAIQAAGVDENAAQAITTAIQESILDVRDQLATKSDMDNLRDSTKSEIENLRVATKSEMENLHVATKSEIENLSIATKSEIENLRVSLTATIDTKIAEVGVKIAEVGESIATAQSATIKWIVATGLSVIGVIVAVAVAFAKLA